MTRWKPAERSDIANMMYAQAEANSRFKRIEPEYVIAAAQRKTGLTDFGSQDFMPRLQVLIDSINEEARLNPLGLNAAGVSMIVSMLVGRLELQSAQKRQPEIFQRQITKPIFIVGGSRTGTTLLQRLLANDPRLCTPLLWQMSSTLTYALGDDAARTVLRNRVDTGQKMLHLLNPSMKAVHFSEADGPEECVCMMGTDLRNLALMACMNTPLYSAMLEKEDFTESYLRHRQQLQLLDSRADIERHGEPVRWLLKAPYHLPNLEALVAAYPDACIVHTHRDVVDTVTSTCSLYSVFRSTFSDEVDPVEVGRQQSVMLSGWFNNTVTARKNLAASHARCFDVHYPELVADPLKVAENILQFAGLEPTETGRHAMQQWLQQNRQDKHGGHRYRPE